MRSLPWLALLLVGMTLPASGCREAGADARPQRPAEPAIEVETASAVEQTVASYLTVTGSLVANQKADVAADTSGRVLAARVERGAWVAKGAPLIVLDASRASLSNRAARAQAEAAEVQSELAAADCQRADNLVAGGAISHAEHDRQRAQCQVSRLASSAASAQADLAGRMTSDSIVRAPFSGIVAERLVSPGEYVRPDSPVITLLDISSLRLELTIPEAAALRVRESQKVSFQVLSLPDQTFEATVRYVGPALRRASRDLIVEAVLDNADGTLRPGMFATARLELGTEKVTVIPATAVKEENGAKRVFVAGRDRLEERVVAVREAQNDVVVVASGVRAGEAVVRRITALVRDGVRIR